MGQEIERVCNGINALKAGAELECQSITIVIRKIDRNRGNVTVEFPSLNTKRQRGHEVTMKINRFARYLLENRQ